MDFRYRLGDGEVEAFQMVPGMRYRQKDWPEWMSAHHFMTVDGVEWLNVDNRETMVPEFDWIVRRPDGAIVVESWAVMEGAEKVVPDEPVVIHPETKVADEEALLQLASKLTGKTVEELQAKPVAAPHLEVVADPVVPSPNLVDGKTININSMQPDLLATRKAYEAMKSDYEVGFAQLTAVLSDCTEWCSCSPGHCAGREDEWECRERSPLVT